MPWYAAKSKRRHPIQKPLALKFGGSCDDARHLAHTGWRDWIREPLGVVVEAIDDGENAMVYVRSLPSIVRELQWQPRVHWRGWRICFFTLTSFLLNLKTESSLFSMNVSSKEMIDTLVMRGCYSLSRARKNKNKNNRLCRLTRLPRLTWLPSLIELAEIIVPPHPPRQRMWRIRRLFPLPERD